MTASSTIPSSPAPAWRTLARCIGGACLTVGLLYVLWQVVPWTTVGHAMTPVGDVVSRGILRVQVPLAHAIGWIGQHLWAMVLWVGDGILGLSTRYPLAVLLTWSVTILSTFCIFTHMHALGFSPATTVQWRMRLADLLLGMLLFGVVEWFVWASTPPVTQPGFGMDGPDVHHQLDEMRAATAHPNFSQQVAAINDKLAQYGHWRNNVWRSDDVGQLRVVDAQARVAAFDVDLPWKPCRHLAEVTPDFLMPARINGTPVSSPASILAACDRAALNNTVEFHTRPGLLATP